MPTYEYQARDPAQSCSFCRRKFELVQRVSDKPLTACPRCRAPVRKIFPVPNIAPDPGEFDRRAQAAGFHKLKRADKGVYEKKY